MTARVERFRSELAEAGFDGAIVSRPEHVFYLCGYAAPVRGLTYLVVGPRGVGLVTSGKGAEIPGEPEIQVFSYEYYRPTQLRDVDEASLEALAAGISTVGLRGVRTGVEDSYLSARAFQSLVSVCDAVSLGGLIERMRLRKDENEIAAIRRAVSINDRGLTVAQRVIAPGVSELEVYAAIYREVLLSHGAPYTLRGDFVSGARTERIGGPPSSRVLEEGDLFIIDIFPVLDWYKGDFTRNFVVGKPNARQLEVHRVLEDALAAGAAVIRPGIRACDLDAVVRESVTAAGYGAYFPHHSGHAIGLDHPEPPYIIPADPTPLQSRMVITLEPGIYIPGFGGMRLEQNFLVTDTGAEPLSSYPLKLIPCG
ncbi:MAG: Xaa-Pro peptidase family protein [Chloroflexi bacterium]|nr:Xaa-Pro peptidase family protein [Chloroflexota bacterium]